MFDVQEENRAKEQVIIHVDKLPLYFLKLESMAEAVLVQNS